VETTKRRRVALLLGNEEIHNGRITGGIVEHVRQHVLNWNILLVPPVVDDEALAGLMLHADAFIGSSDEHDLGPLAARGVPVVGVGLGAPRGRYGARPPAVLADNAAVARKAYDYMIGQGAARFAMFSAGTHEGTAWLRERERAFATLAQRDGAAVALLRCEHDAHPLSGPMRQVIAWLVQLPRPVAIFAPDSVCARMLGQACALAGYDSGAQILIVGVDSDPLAQELSPVALASVMLDRHEMGRRAALMLQRALDVCPGIQDEQVAPLELAQAPHGNAAAPLCDPLVMRAMHFIRLNAQRGIKAAQVAYNVGMSRSALETRFKRERGHSVHDEILRFKLEQAKQMLTRGVASMPDVALSCGFTSVQYLYTVFGREIGCTPRVWQERMLRQRLLQAA